MFVLQIRDPRRTWRVESPYEGREVVHISSLAQWRERWNAAQTFEELEGLIHCLCEIHCVGAEWDDRFILCLSLAHGLRNSSQHRYGSLQQKAWKLLVMKFLRVDKELLHSLNRPPHHWSRFLEAKLFDVLLDFFLDARPNQLIPYKGDSRIEEITASDFMNRFVRMWWQHGRYLIPALRDDPERRRRAWELLSYLGELDLLVEHSETLDSSDLDFLRSYTLAEGKYGTLEQAFARTSGGVNSTARTLLLIEAKRKGRFAAEEQQK